MFEEAWAAVVGKIQDFLTGDLLFEAIGLLVILLSGLLLAFILRRVLRRLETAVSNWPKSTYLPWLVSTFQIAQAGVLPLSFYVAGVIVINIMDNLNAPHEILDWLLPFVVLWLIYSLGSAFISQHVAPEKRGLWLKQILRPTIIILAIGHAIGLLDIALNYEINFGKGVVVSIGAIFAGLIVLYIFVLLGRWLRALLRDVILPRMDADPSVIPIVSTFSGYAVVAIGILVGFMVAGVNMTSVFVILGGLSVGLGFGLKELVNNFVSGFILLFERSIAPGDIIDMNSASGEVQDIRLRTTRVRTFDNIELIVPNGTLLADVVTNYSQKEGTRHKRIRIPVGASYHNDPHEVMAVLLKASDQQPGILEYPEPQVYLIDFGDNSINYELRAWVTSANQMFSTSSTLRLKIWDLFAKHGIEMPYPQRDVHIISDNTPNGENNV